MHTRYRTRRHSTSRNGASFERLLCTLRLQGSSQLLHFAKPSNSNTQEFVHVRSKREQGPRGALVRLASLT